MADIDPDREAMRKALDNWHAREPLSPKSISDTGCFLDVLVFGLLVFAVTSGLLTALATAAMWLEEDGSDCSVATANVIRAQCTELQIGRERQDVGHGVHGAAAPGGDA